VSPLDALRRIVRNAVGDYRFERSYYCVVERSYEDGSVDVLPDDIAMRGIGLQRVPAPTVAPSTIARSLPGARCLLAFDKGDPRAPTITVWEYGIDTATVQLNGGVASVARKGDMVDVLLSAATPIAGVLSGTISTPNPSPPPATVDTPVPAGTPFTGVATITGTVRGVIIGGAANVKA
jgi:hypothetical protein